MPIAAVETDAMSDTIGEPVARAEAMLRRVMHTLADEIGTRHATVRPEGLARAAEFISSELAPLAAAINARAAGGQPGCAATLRQRYFSVPGSAPVANIELEIRPATPDADGADRSGATAEARRDRGKIAVIGCHYDCGRTSPGANDNATGVAAVLHGARTIVEEITGAISTPRPGADRPESQWPGRTVRFVFFANEEGPFFKTPLMGSRVYVEECRLLGDRFDRMLCIDEIGYYSDAPDSQRYPPLIGRHLPRTGHFLAVIGDRSARSHLDGVVHAYRSTDGVAAEVPAVIAALPYFLPKGGFSDEWPFYRAGVPAALVTDTGPMRYPQYHTPEDTPDRVDLHRTAHAMHGLVSVMRSMVS